MSGCLLAISESEALQLVTSCIREVDGLSPPEKKLLITEKIREGSAGRTEGGYLKVKYKVGVGSNEYMDHVCPKLFARCYEISSRHWYVRLYVCHNIALIYLYFRILTPKYIH